MLPLLPGPGRVEHAFVLGSDPPACVELKGCMAVRRYLNLPESTRAQHVRDKSNAAYILGWSERRVTGKILTGLPTNRHACWQLKS